MGGIRSKPTSSLQVPEKKYRATSAPPDTCTPTCPRYPVPSADTSGSWNKLYALTLSWRHACGSLRGRAVCVKMQDRKSTRLNSSHTVISYAVFCLKKKKKK